MSDRTAKCGLSRTLGIDMDELLVLCDFGEGVDPLLADGDPARHEALSDHGGEFGGGNLLNICQIVHSWLPNIAGGAVTPTPPSTGTIAPVV